MWRSSVAVCGLLAACAAGSVVPEVSPATVADRADVAAEVAAALPDTAQPPDDVAERVEIAPLADAATAASLDAASPELPHLDDAPASIADTAPDAAADADLPFVEPDIVVDGPPATICLTSQQCPGSSNPCAVPACVKGTCISALQPDGTPCSACGFAPTCQGGVCVTVPLTYTKVYPAPGLDEPRALLRHSDGSYFVVGMRKVVPGTSDILILHIAAAGTLLWEQTFDFAAIEVATAATLDAQGLLIAGHFSNGAADTWDAQLVRVNLAGTLQWRKVFATANADRLFGLVATGATGWLAVGEQGPSGAVGSIKDSEMWALHVDTAGETLQTLTYGTPQHDVALAAAVLTDGSWVLAGQVMDGTGPADAIAVHTDAVGKLLWQKMWPSPAWNRWTSAAALPSGAVALGGTWRGPKDTDSYDSWVVRLSADATELNEHISHDVSGANRVVSMAATATEAVDYLVAGAADPEDTGATAARPRRLSWCAELKSSNGAVLAAAVAMVQHSALSAVVGSSGSAILLQRYKSYWGSCTVCACATGAAQCMPEMDCGAGCNGDAELAKGMPCNDNGGGCDFWATKQCK